MKKKVKMIQIIHLALCAGLVIAYLLIGKLTALESIPFPEINASNMVYAFAPIVAIILGNQLYHMQIKSVDNSLSLEEKFPTYQTASIIRYAILEGTAFLILFIRPDFILFGVLIILYLMFLRPTEDKIITAFEA